MGATNEWIEKWSQVKHGELFPGDEAYLKNIERAYGCTLTAKRRDLNEKSGKLHCDLGGVPYVGNLNTACIFLLMVNPTVCETDYEDYDSFTELFDKNREQVLEYCFAIDKNGPDGWRPYYCNSVFGNLFKDLSDLDRVKLRSNLAILELVPYFSKNASLITGLRIVEGRRNYRMKHVPVIEVSATTGLPSAGYALRAVKEIASKRDNLIITRWKTGAKRWQLKDENYCKYEHVLATVVESSCRNGLSKEAQTAIRTRLKSIC